MDQKDQMLVIAEKVARLLLDEVDSVDQVALFGSLARGEEHPSDVDLFVLTADSGIPERILAEAERNCERLYASGYLPALSALGAQDILSEFRRIIGTIDVNIVVMPAEPTDDYLGRFAQTSFDVDFLENTAEDFQAFDPESGEFVPTAAPWWAFEALDEFHDYETRCPNCDAVVEWNDEICANCGACLLPLPPGGFGPDGRSHWGPRQVRTSRGIKLGNVLTMVQGRSHEKILIVVVSEPHLDDELGWLCFDCLDPGGSLSRLPLTDFGVVPYVNGRWNRINHLLRTGRHRVDVSKLLDA